MRAVFSGHAVASLAVLVALGCGSDEPVPSRDRATRTVSLVFVGDVMFDGAVASDLDARGLGPDALFEPTREAVAAAEFSAFNLESAVSDTGEPIDKRYNFDSDASALGALARAGFDLANLANNHVLDYGPQGLQDTLDHLDAAGIASCGITRLDEPQTPFVIEVGGITLGFLGYADAEAPTAYAQEFLQFETRPVRADPALIARDIASLRPLADIVVIEVHWGIEAQDATARQQQLGRFMVDQGADIVVGHHPHIVQGAEWYAGGLILYSLGHFVFEFPADPDQMKSVLVRVTADAQGVRDAERLDLATRLYEWIPRPVTGVWERID